MSPFDLRFRLHIPPNGRLFRSTWRLLGDAMIAARQYAEMYQAPVHVIDTRAGGGLVTVIGAPGSWDKPVAHQTGAVPA